jgi:hypothetical protein
VGKRKSNRQLAKRKHEIKMARRMKKQAERDRWYEIIIKRKFIEDFCQRVAPDFSDLEDPSEFIAGVKKEQKDQHDLTFRKFSL